MDHLEKEMVHKLGFVLEENKVYLSDTTLTIKNGHYVFPVANAYKNKVKGHRPRCLAAGRPPSLSRNSSSR
jgi:dsDNA-specific endonuclease/ATPase MutS2